MSEHDPWKFTASLPNYANPSDEAVLTSNALSGQFNQAFNQAFAKQQALERELHSTTSALVEFASAYQAASPEGRAAIEHDLVQANAAQGMALRAVRDEATTQGVTSTATRTLAAELSATLALVALDQPGGPPSPDPDEPVPASHERLTVLPPQDPVATNAIQDLAASVAALTATSLIPEFAHALPSKPGVSLEGFCQQANRTLSAIADGVRTDLTAMHDVLPDSLPANLEKVRAEVENVLKDVTWLLRLALERLLAALEWVLDQLKLHPGGGAGYLDEARQALTDPEGLIPHILGIPAAEHDIEALAETGLPPNVDLTTSFDQLRSMTQEAGETFDNTARSIHVAVAVAKLTAPIPLIAGRVIQVVGIFVGCCAAYAIAAGRDYVDAPRSPSFVPGVRTTISRLSAPTRVVNETHFLRRHPRLMLILVLIISAAVAVAILLPIALT